MITKIKSPLLLIPAALLCLFTSCGPKDTSDNNSSEEATEQTTTEKESSTEEEALAEEETIETATADLDSAMKVFSDEPVKGRGQWDASSKMYNDDPRNLFWDLSFYKNWNTFDESKLPKPVQFVVENADNGILAALVAFPLVDKKITSIYEIPKEMVYNEIMKVQNKMFVQSKNQEPVINKVTFRNKSAYEISFKADVPDQRSGERVSRQYSIRMVTMVSDHELIELMVMAPPAGLERFGDDIFNMLIGKFNFVN